MVGGCIKLGHISSCFCRKLGVSGFSPKVLPEGIFQKKCLEMGDDFIEKCIKIGVDLTIRINCYFISSKILIEELFWQTIESFCSCFLLIR